MKVTTDRIKNCAFIKTVLMILIVVGHSCIFWAGNWFTKDPIYPSQWLGIISQWLNSFHTYAFTLISGYIFCYKIHKGHYQKYRPFLINKMKRLLIPYAFAVIIWVAPISCYFLHFNTVELVRKYVLCENPSQLWFLWMLFWIFVIIWPMRKLIIEYRAVGLTIGLIFFCISIIGEEIIPNIFCVWRACRYIIYFIIGINIREREERKENNPLAFVPMYIWVLLHAVLFALSLHISKYSDGFISILKIGLSALCNAVGAYMAFLVLNVLSDTIKWRENRLIKTLTRLSMPVYLFHQQIIYFSISYLNGKINPWINALLNFTISISGAVIISLCLMKCGLTRKLIGEK